MSPGRVDATVTDAEDEVRDADRDTDADADTDAAPAEGERRNVVVRAAERFRARIRRNKVLNTTWRVAVSVVGAVVLLAGLVMMVTPGPGWLAIVLGFAILATEFVWARRALLRARHAAHVAKRKALDPRVRRRNQIVLAAVLVLAAAACITYLAVFGPMLPWNPVVLRELP